MRINDAPVPVCDLLKIEPNGKRPRGWILIWPWTLTSTVHVYILYFWIILPPQLVFLQVCILVTNVMIQQT